MDELELQSPPRKKVKILDSDDISTEATEDLVTISENSNNNTSTIPPPDTENDSMAGKHGIRTLIAMAEIEQMQKELAVGIEVFVSTDAGFQGVLKRR